MFIRGKPLFLLSNTNAKMIGDLMVAATDEGTIRLAVQRHRICPMGQVNVQA